MKLIVGLGNTGERYARTRHNVGFMVADQLQKQLDLSKWEKTSHQALLAGNYPRTVMAVKPQTMMNLSGRSVGELMRYYRLHPDDVWVVHDEVDVPFGRLRVRKGGTTTHNGVRSVIEQIGDGFWRYRVGVANARYDETPTDRFVLSAFSKEEQPELAKVVNRAAEIIVGDLGQEQPPDTTYNLLI